MATVLLSVEPCTPESDRSTSGDLTPESSTHKPQLTTLSPTKPPDTFPLWTIGLMVVAGLGFLVLFTFAIFGLIRAM